MTKHTKIKYDYKGVGIRICLYCGREFKSKGTYNRKCHRCCRNEKLFPTGDYDIPKYKNHLS